MATMCVHCAHGSLLTRPSPAYNIPNWLVKGKVCRTHTPCNTWTRSPGTHVTAQTAMLLAHTPCSVVTAIHTPAVPTALPTAGSVPAVFIIESVLDHVGKSLGIPQEEVRLVNLYNQDDLTLQWVPLEHCNIQSVWQGETLCSCRVVGVACC